jgi:RecB family exonuclease
MQFSYSRLSCFANCPYQYKLKYLDGLKTLPLQNADNALYLGTAIHEAFETGKLEDAIKSYRSNYYCITDAHINEEIKLEYLIPKVLELLPDAECEVEISTDDFIGYIDRLVYLFTDEAGIAHYEIWDYKYSNNIDHYLESAQLHLYKYYFEKTHPNTVVDALKYVFIPKVNIRQKFKAKPPETIQEFRVRLLEHLKCVEPQIKEVKFDETMVTRFQECCQRLETVKKFPKNPTKLCNWCQFQQYCESDGEIDYMIMQNDQK